MATMSSINGVLKGYVGMFGVSLVTHVVGGALLILGILAKREKIRLWPMPWYLYSAGFFGLIQVAGSSICITQIGAALTACLSIAGNLSQSILVDHFGWLGMKKEAFNKRRIPGLLILLLGILIVNFGGNGVEMGKIGLASVPAMLLSFLEGSIGVYSRTVNFKATEHLGLANGTLVNYVTASILSLLCLICFGTPENWAGFGEAPLWVYLGGVCGVVALVFNVTSLKKLTLFQSGTLMLTGQLFCSALLDGVMFNNMSVGKFLGVIVVAIGVVIDKKTALAERVQA